MRLSFSLAFCALLLGASILWYSCLRDQCTETLIYTRYDPIFVQPQDFRNTGVVAEAPRPLKKSGKMYLIGTYLLINEQMEGIHVFDNSDPSSPAPIVFWKIPGNVDMAIRGQYLYADQYVDLLSIDISHIQQPRIVCRTENVFSLKGYYPGRGYFVGYKKTDVTERLECTDSRYGMSWYEDEQYIFMRGDMSANPSLISSSVGLPTGIAGSFARFGQWGEYLYCVDNNKLHSFSAANPACPVKQYSQQVGWNIETIFPFKNRLFIGSNNAVHIFRLDNPALPSKEAVFSHATGCDPVVCDEDKAYVTLHGGTDCNGTLNQLDVLDVRNLPQVSLVRTYPMKKPMGLAVSGNLLFVCDDGLKIYDKTNPAALRQLSHVNDIETFDVIALSVAHVLVIGKSGFFQYDVSNPSAPRLLSQIRIQP